MFSIKGANFEYYKAIEYDAACHLFGKYDYFISKCHGKNPKINATTSEYTNNKYLNHVLHSSIMQ